MKRLLTVFLLTALLISSVFAYTNEQKIYSVDSGVYEAMETLYILAGRSLPSSSGPWSEAELQLMLSYIDKSALPQSAQDYYDYVESMVTSEPKQQYADNLGMSFGLDVSLQGYYHTNTAFDDYDKWFHSFSDREKFLVTSFETWPTNSFYGYFELSFADGIGHDANKASGNVQYMTNLNVNIPILNSILFTKDDIFDNFNWTFPERAFAAAGGQHWSLMAGRDKLSWGAGETGNLMLSDSLPFHNMVRFNTFFENFKYSLVGTIYPFDASGSQYSSLDGYKSLIVHRLEFNMLGNKLGLVVNEACMFWSDPTSNQSFSLAQINPFGFMHNEYIPRNGNSLLVFEADYTPISGVNVYGQFALDEITGPGEGKWNPPASAYLAGVKGAMVAGKGILTGSLEYAHTDPYIYIRGLHYTDKSSGYGFDAIYRSFNAGIVNTKMFTTYKYGNDVNLFDAKVGYEVSNSFKVGFEALVMNHGCLNINSAWGMYQGNDDPTPVVKTPSTFNAFDPADYDYSTHTVRQEHAVEKTVVLSLTGEYQIVKGLSANLAADYILVKNMNNVADNNQNDLQISLGIKYSI